MLLKCSSFRYNNVNRASKTKVGELCHSVMSNTIYFNWRSCRDRIFWRVGGKTHKNYFHKKYFHSLRTDIFPRNTFHILYVPRKSIPAQNTFWSILWKENYREKHFHENKYQYLSKKFQYIYAILFCLLKFSVLLFNARFLLGINWSLKKIQFDAIYVYSG